MQNQLDNKVYAGFFVRFVAFAIDSLIAALAVATIKSPFSIAAANGVDFLNANFLFHYSFLDVLDYIGVAAYFVLLTYYTHTTPGKAAMRLEVVTVDKEWTLLNIIYRETVGRFFSSLLCAGYFAVMVSTKKQGFHDMLCDTYVVYKGMMPRPKDVPVPENITEVSAVASNPVSEVEEENIVSENNLPVNATTNDYVEEQQSVETSSVMEEVSEEATSAEQQKIVPPTYYTKPGE